MQQADMSRFNKFLKRLKEEVQYEDEKYIFNTPLDKQIHDRVKALEELCRNPDKYRLGGK